MTFRKQLRKKLHDSVREGCSCSGFEQNGAISAALRNRDRTWAGLSLFTEGLSLQLLNCYFSDSLTWRFSKLLLVEKYLLVIHSIRCRLSAALCKVIKNEGTTTIHITYVKCSDFPGNLGPQA